MIGSAKVRKARKAAQKARLKKKGDKDYPAFYANLPQQKVKAEANDKLRTARADLASTAESLQIAEITGEGLLAAQEAAHVARLVVEKMEASKRPSAQIALTAAGGN